LKHATSIVSKTFKKLLEKSMDLSALSPEYLADLAKELSDMSFSVSNARNKASKKKKLSMTELPRDYRESMTLRKTSANM
jgi:hypothetical protein